MKTSELIPPVGTTLFRCLAHRNGFDATDTIVLPIPGDPQGGGNSDGIGWDKNCVDILLGACITELLYQNICWHNADDGICLNVTQSAVIGNVCIANGPMGNRGIKELRNTAGSLYASNIVIQNAIGVEMRGIDTMDRFHNFGLSNTNKGLSGDLQGIAGGRYHNNVASGNANADLFGEGTASHNWANGAGDPGLTNLGASINLTLAEGSVQARWQYLMDQIEAAYKPAVGSPLINAGLFIDGYHCARADDDPVSPMPPTAAGRHWMGTAPDLGPFEFGITGLPDRTGMGSQTIAGLRLRHPISAGAF
jgi:hypothetical protein